MIARLLFETECLIRRLDAIVEHIRETGGADLARIEQLVREAREQASQLRARIAAQDP